MSDIPNPNPYNDYVAQYEAAYLAHKSTYELRTPKPEKIAFAEPEPQKPRGRLENAGTLVLLGLLVVASMIVSGSRTIPEFGDVGVPAFLMLEMGLITYAFIRTSRNYSTERHKALNNWVNFGMGMAFIVLLAANIDSVLTRQGIDLPPEVNLVIDLFVAVSAPVLALISGDVLGMYSVMQRHSGRKADEDYHLARAGWSDRRDAFEADQRAQLDLWRDGLNSSWNSAKKQMGVQIRSPQLERTANDLPEQTAHSFAIHSAANERMNSGAPANETNTSGERRLNPANGYRKSMSAKDRAVEFIRRERTVNPDLMTMSTDQLLSTLVAALGPAIKRTSAFEARRIVLADPEPVIQPPEPLVVGANGNGHHAPNGQE